MGKLFTFKQLENSASVLCLNYGGIVFPSGSAVLDIRGCVRAERHQCCSQSDGLLTLSGDQREGQRFGHDSKPSSAGVRAPEDCRGGR